MHEGPDKSPAEPPSESIDEMYARLGMESRTPEGKARGVLREHSVAFVKNLDQLTVGSPRNLGDFIPKLQELVLDSLAPKIKELATKGRIEVEAVRVKAGFILQSVVGHDKLIGVLQDILREARLSEDKRKSGGVNTLNEKVEEIGKEVFDGLLLELGDQLTKKEAAA